MPFYTEELGSGFKGLRQQPRQASRTRRAEADDNIPLYTSDSYVSERAVLRMPSILTFADEVRIDMDSSVFSGGLAE